MAKKQRRGDALNTPSGEDPRLQRLSALCAALPESERALRGGHADFRVRQKVFAYFLDSHHGDGIVSVCCKAELAQNLERVHSDPQRYYLPAYIGARGWFALRLDRGPIDWDEVQNLLERSYCLVAPRRLVELLRSR